MIWHNRHLLPDHYWLKGLLSTWQWLKPVAAAVRYDQWCCMWIGEIKPCFGFCLRVYGVCVCVRFIFRLKWISGDRSCVFSYAYRPYLCRSIVTTMDFDKNDWLAHGSCCYCCWLWFLVSLVFRSFYSNTHARAHVITMIEQCIVLYWIGYAWFQVYIQTQTLYLRLINGSRTML